MARHRSPRGRNVHLAPPSSEETPTTGASGTPRSPGTFPPRSRLIAGAVAFTAAALVVSAVFSGNPESSTVAAPAVEAVDTAPFEPVVPTVRDTDEQQEALRRAAQPSTESSPTPEAEESGSEKSERRGLTQTGCTTKVTSGAGLAQALAGAGPGDKICATGDMGQDLEVMTSGAPGNPIMVVGNGKTTVTGIDVEADHVVVDGFQVPNPEAPGIWLEGDHITAQYISVSNPTGGDGDGLRFFGNNIKILNNTISGTSNEHGHADCMQTYATSTPASQNVLISGNRCVDVDNMCLMAEGPGDSESEGSGEGESSNWTFSNNYCDTNASQALMIEAVQDVTVTGNEIVGEVDKAFAFDIGSTGATIRGNEVAPGIEYVVGMDDSSRAGYVGPQIGGGP